MIASSAHSSAAARCFIKAITAALMVTAEGSVRSIDGVLRQFYPGDQAVALLTKVVGTERREDANLLLKATSTPTTLASANELAVTALGAFVVSLAPQSAAVKLLSRGATFSLDGVGSLEVPTVASSATLAAFVGEGSPIPVRQCGLWRLDPDPVQVRGDRRVRARAVRPFWGTSRPWCASCSAFSGSGV